MRKDDKISVIICTKDRPDDLIKCLDSLVIQTSPISELIIIDSSEQKRKLYSIIKKYKKKLKIKYFYYKSSLTEARNLGVRKASGNIIIFLDDDVILDKNYISEIIKIFKSYGKEVGLVTGNIISEETRTERFYNLVKIPMFRKIRNVIYRMFFLFSLGDGKFHPSGLPSFPFGKNKIMFIEAVQGSNMAFRKEVLDKLKFDENLKGFSPMEDCDISYRVSRKYKVVYTPYAKLIHNVSRLRTSRFMWRKMLTENHYYYFNKNFPHTFSHKFAFWWSILGSFLILLITDRKEFRGLLSGLKSILTKSINF
jgi:GT2 family glycosyltransferase